MLVRQDCTGQEGRELRLQVGRVLPDLVGKERHRLVGKERHLLVGRERHLLVGREPLGPGDKALLELEDRGHRLLGPACRVRPGLEERALAPGRSHPGHWLSTEVVPVAECCQ